MLWQAVGKRTVPALAALALAWCAAPRALAQENDVEAIGQAGVVVDAQGVLHTHRFPDPGGQLTRERLQAARQNLDPQVARSSPLRKVSLNRLEAAVAANSGALTDEMRYLAGMLRVRFVFFYPETKDIVLAGPAEGWATMPSGRVVGITTGRPTLRLDDLVVALRAFPPDGEPTPAITCSIDPTPEGLAAMQQFLRRVSGYRPGQEPMIAEGLRTSLGLQTVAISGVSPQTHFAQVLVEADYRMKLIGIGLEQPPVRMASFVDRVNPRQVRRNALMRWYFVPDYECVRMSDDGLAMELVGEGVKLVGEDELVTAGGERVAAARRNPASEAFVNSFTQRYPELAQRSPVFAQLRNAIDLAVVAAYIQQEDLYHRAEWPLELFGDEGRFSVETYTAPQYALPAVNALTRGNQLMLPVGGGVRIEPALALIPDHILADQSEHLSRARQETAPQLAEGQWWWD